MIHSGDDFGINDAGIMITETTIGNFHGFNAKGIPEFVRARKAMQYSESIDDFARIMEQGNNGGYANTWLIGDRKNNEIGRLELGLKYVTLERTSDGYFVGSNFPINPKLISEETDFPAERSQHAQSGPAAALGSVDGREQGPHRRCCRQEVRDRSLRHGHQRVRSE